MVKVSMGNAILQNLCYHFDCFWENLLAFLNWSQFPGFSSHFPIPLSQAHCLHINYTWQKYEQNHKLRLESSAHQTSTAYKNVSYPYCDSSSCCACITSRFCGYFLWRSQSVLIILHHYWKWDYSHIRVKKYCLSP